jgi:Domain of unknown function (DUF4260)
MLTKPGILLRAEALLVLAASVFAYRLAAHGNWWVFALFFLAPDLSLLGYLSKTHTGPAAALYNAVHSYALPLILAAVGWKIASSPLEQAALIWTAHIAFDRTLGFGLKFPQAFKPTHLQRAGVWG